MAIFIDSSAFVAMLDRKDINHSAAQVVWSELLTTEEHLYCSNYILLETIAVIQRKLGLEAIRDFNEFIAPLLQIDWVDQTIHDAGLSSMLAANRRRLSLVDCISFETMRRLGLRRAFTFDPHFKEQGFECYPR